MKMNILKILNSAGMLFYIVIYSVFRSKGD